MNEITGKERPLSKIFSKDYDFHIPGYQRPYAWTTVETGELLNDLYDTYCTNPTGTYFLGSIVLIKKDERSPIYDVVDGQQRLTTLTILLSVLASKLEGTLLFAGCAKYLYESGDEFEELPSSPRLHLREKDARFFEMVQYVKTSSIAESRPENEAQEHIKKNWEYIDEKISDLELDKDEIVNFCKFIVKNCYLIAVTTQSEESAFRIFSVLNNRGMDLLPVDILKSEIIGNISAPEKQTIYTNKWENMENELGRNGFNDLFTHIRMIYAKEKSRQMLVQAFKENVLAVEENRSAESFIDDVLAPYQKAYYQITRQGYESTEHAGDVNRLLSWLNNIDFSDWIPSAMLYLRKFGNNPKAVLNFFKKLERLAAFLHITGQDVNHRIKRFSKILAELSENNANCNIKAVELTDEEKKEFRQKLNGPIYSELTDRRRNYLIMRLDSFVSDDSKATDYKRHVLSIEHVLPQTISPSSEWAKWWPDVKIRDKWLHCIGNLVPLSRKKNSAAQNFKFEDKKQKYFKSPDGVCAYPLTTQIMDEVVWTPETVEKRQKELMKKFKEKWDL